MATLVSVAGGADLGVEIDLHTLSQDIEAEVVEYEPESYPALYLRFEEDGATVMLFSSGKYNIAGASSIKELYETHQRLVETISSMLDVEIEAEDECDLRNLVYTDDFGSNLRLEKLVLLSDLGFVTHTITIGRAVLAIDGSSGDRSGQQR